MSLKDLILDVDGSQVPGYDQAAADRVVSAMDGGAPFKRACTEAGVDYTSAYRWRRLNVERFAERVAGAMEAHYEAKLEEAFEELDRLDNEDRGGLGRVKVKLDNAWKAVERVKPDRYSPTLITATRGADGKIAPVMAMVVVPPKSTDEMPETSPPVEGGPAD